MSDSIVAAIMLAADPHGCRTMAGAKAAYVAGVIDVEELERRIDLFLQAEDARAKGARRRRA